LAADDKQALATLRNKMGCIDEERVHGVTELVKRKAGIAEVRAVVGS
jgi:hypothetical protein